MDEKPTYKIIEFPAMDEMEATANQMFADGYQLHSWQWGGLRLIVTAIFVRKEHFAS